jgi:hypothetical protein
MHQVAEKLLRDATVNAFARHSKTTMEGLPETLF